jgi:hypothetical protein
LLTALQEGQGRTLEELDTMYIEKVIPWKSRDWVAPPPEEIARIRKEAGTYEAAEAGDVNGVANGVTNGEDDNISREEKESDRSSNGNKDTTTA